LRLAGVMAIIRFVKLDILVNMGSTRRRRLSGINGLWVLPRLEYKNNNKAKDDKEK
jgi:hypothetical protein